MFEGEGEGDEGEAEVGIESAAESPLSSGCSGQLRIDRSATERFAARPLPRCLARVAPTDARRSRGNVHRIRTGANDRP